MYYLHPIGKKIVLLLPKTATHEKTFLSPQPTETILVIKAQLTLPFFDTE